MPSEAFWTIIGNDITLLTFIFSGWLISKIYYNVKQANIRKVENNITNNYGER